MFYSVLVRNTVIGLYSLYHCVPDSALCRSIRDKHHAWLQKQELSRDVGCSTLCLAA